MTESRYRSEGGIIGWMASNPIAANLLMLVVFCAGLASLGSIRKEVFPSFPTDTFTVTVPYPGSSPEEVEIWWVRPRPIFCRGYREQLQHRSDHLGQLVAL